MGQSQHSPTKMVNEIGNENYESVINPVIDATIKPVDERNYFISDSFLSPFTIDMMNEEYDFKLPSDEQKEKLVNECIDYLYKKTSFKVCLLSDREMSKTECTYLFLDQLPYEAMKKALLHITGVPKQALKEYDCSKFDCRLAKMPLSPRAIVFDEKQGKHGCWVSTKALSFLKKYEAIPKFSIADNFFLGNHHAFRDATDVELQCVCMAKISGRITVVYKGVGDTLNSTLLAYDVSEATIASELPCSTEQISKIIIVGLPTTEQELLLKKAYNFRPAKVKELHQLLTEKNKLYSSFRTNKQTDLGSIKDFILYEEESAELTELFQNTTALQHSYNETVEDNRTQVGGLNEIECVVVENKMNIDDRKKRAFINLLDKHDENKTYVAQMSADILKSQHPRFFEMLFPHLFQYGCSGPTEKRLFKYSDRELAEHYLNLSTKTFAEDKLFRLVWYDYVSKKEVLQSMYLKTRWNKKLITTSANITKDDIEIAEEISSNDAYFAISNISTEDENELLSAIESGATSRLGGNKERQLFQLRIDSMIYELGSPSLFFTFNPTPDNSITVAIWSGKYNNGSIDTENKQQLMETTMPCPSEMRDLISKNTNLQVRYFNICVEALIEILFKFDLKSNKPKSEPGISADEIKNIRKMFGGLDNNHVIGRLQLSKLLRTYQTHSYCHTLTCTKTKHNDMHCRFHFPFEVCETSDFNENEQVDLQRLLGCQWLNKFNDCIAKVFFSTMTYGFFATEEYMLHCMPPNTPQNCKKQCTI